MSVLFVDDDKDYVELAVRFLKSGCIDSVDGVTSAMEALQRLESREYDVIICDYLMPEMDGVQLLEEIRSRGIDTPFVLMTGKDREDTVSDPIALGANLQVQKTGDMKQRFSELSDIIKNLACWKRTERRLIGERDLFRDIVDSNMIGLIVLDDKANVTVWSRGITDITGIDKATVIGRPFSLHSSHVLGTIISEAEVDGLLRGCMRPSSRRTCTNPETGVVRHFEVGMFPMLGRDGEFTAGLIHILDSTQRVQLIEALEDSEKKYRQLVEMADEGIWSVDRHNRFTFVNPRMASTMASRPEKMIGERLSDFVSDRDKEFADEALKLCTEGSSIELDFDFVNSAGKRQVVGFKASPIFDSAGEYHGAVAVFTDLAGRRLIEEALTESLRSQEEFGRIVNASPVVVFKLDPVPPWRVDFISDNVTQFGFTPDDFRDGKTNFADVVHPDDLERLESEVLGHITDGEDVFAAEYLGLTKKGETRNISAQVLVRRDSEGNVIGFQGIIIDDTERKKGMEEVKRLASIVENSMDAIISKSTDGTILTWNPAAEALYGYSADEAVGKSITMVVPPDRLDEFYRRFRQVKSGIRVPPFETVRVRKDGSRVDVSLTISPVLNDMGRIVGASAIARDISARRKAEEALKAANDKLALMGSITRHDVINQIGILSGYLSLIEGDTGDAKTRSQYLSAARKACSTITEQLQFAGSYQKAGTKDPEWTRVRLELAGSVSTIDMGEISVKESLGDLEVLADPMFEKVFVNLLVNTRRHSEKATRVDVTVDRRGDELVITYSDDGIGIATDEKEKIFNRGYGRDSGLGLFLIREVLAITGITILERGTPGEGVRFEMTIPPGKFRFGS